MGNGNCVSRAVWTTRHRSSIPSWGTGTRLRLTTRNHRRAEIDMSVLRAGEPTGGGTWAAKLVPSIAFDLRREPTAGKLHGGIWCSEDSCHSSGCKSRQHKSLAANPLTAKTPRHWATRGEAVAKRFWRRRRPGRNKPSGLATLQRYEGHSALRCCTGLPWRNMFTPTRTAGTAQTTQPAL